MNITRGADQYQHVMEIHWLGLVFAILYLIVLMSSGLKVKAGSLALARTKAELTLALSCV